MIRKDFYMRMIEEMGRNIARLVEQYRSGRKEDTREDTDDTFVNFFDMRAEAARRLPREELERRMEADGPEKRVYWQHLADLLLLDGDLLRDIGEEEEALMAWRQSLLIYTWLQTNVDTVFSFDRLSRIRELKERVSF